MSNDELLTDDYVADLLAKEANDCSLKYSAMGLEAFNTKYKPSNAPKPNKRFLRNIIRDTDTHNKALLAKEAAESKARLKDLERAEEAKRRKTDPTAGDIRRRQLGNIQSILGGSRQRRGENTRTADEEKSRAKGDGDRHSHRSSRRERDGSTERRKPRKDYGRLSRSPSEERRTYHEDQSRSSRRRHRDSSSDGKRRHARDRQRDRSRSPRRHRSRSPRAKRSKHRSRSPLAAEKEPSRESRHRNDGDESDPLEEFIGPAPPPKYRGRGTVAGTASLDRRFSDSYDPSTDVLPDKDEDNWDDAVEAFRDRQKLRRTQEERMRAAGFADHQIQKINNSQREKTEEDVVWSKAGEKREWDRGKGEDGDDDGDDIVLRGILSEEL